MRSPRRLPPRVAIPILLALGAASFVAYHWHGARLTIANVGIVVDYAPMPAIFILVCAASILVLGVLAATPLVRLAALALALATAFFGLDSLSFGITAERDALHVKGLMQRATLPWTQIAKVENEPFAVVLVDVSGQRLRLDLATFTAQQRAAFDRTLARRIWESGAPHRAD